MTSGSIHTDTTLQPLILLTSVSVVFWAALLPLLLLLEIGAPSWNGHKAGRQYCSNNETAHIEVCFHQHIQILDIAQKDFIHTYIHTYTRYSKTNSMLTLGVRFLLEHSDIIWQYGSKG